MISGIVILGSLALAIAFAILRGWRSDLRSEIEQPKHWFQEQVRRYDQRCDNERKTRGTRR